MPPVVPPGVKFIPPPPPLMSDLRRSINDAVASLKTGEKGALVLVGTKQGNDPVSFNAAVVAKVGKGWAVQSWIGKSWGQPVAGGVTVLKTW